MSYLIAILGVIGIMAIFTRLAAWLLDVQEPKGKHHARPSVQVQSDIDLETIEIFQTMNRPPAEFFGDEPEWVERMRNWHVGSSNEMRELADDAASHAVRCSQIRDELRQMYDAA
jgi:hypothetical protein